MGKVSKLARSALARINLFIDFLNVSVLSDTVVYSAIPYEKIKAVCFWGARSLRSLVHISYMYMIFFYVGTFGGLPPSPPPPPHTKKLATLLLPAFAHQKSGQMKMADSVPPTRYTKSPPLERSDRARGDFFQICVWNWHFFF